MSSPRLVAYGFRSRASAFAALAELESTGLVVRTLQGAKGRLSLFAVTLFPMHCNPQGLDVGPGGYRVDEWRRSDPAAAAAPSSSAPAVWAKTRSRPSKTAPRAASKKRSGWSRSGTAFADAVPQRNSIDACCPATGLHPGVSSPNAVPPRDSPIESHLHAAQQQGTQPAGEDARQPAAPAPQEVRSSITTAAQLADAEAFE
jgi:hypothetical protein